MLTVLGVLPGSKIKTCWASIEYKKMKFETQQESLGKLLTELPVHRLYVDATGLGMNLAENLENRFSSRRVEGITFTNPVIEEMRMAYTWQCSGLSCGCL